MRDGACRKCYRYRRWRHLNGTGSSYNAVTNDLFRKLVKKSQPRGSNGVSVRNPPTGGARILTP